MTIQPAEQGNHPWLIEFLQELRRQKVAAVTLRGYRSDLGLFLRWHDSPSLEKLTAGDVMNYQQHLSGERGFQPASINRRLQALRRFCRWAHGEGKLPANPAAEVKLAKVRGLRPVGLTDREVNAVLRAVRLSKPGWRKRNYALVQLLLQTGMRVSELAALRVGDTVVQGWECFVKIRHGEGCKQREVPLNTIACCGLSAYLEDRQPLRPEEPLITNEYGDAISVRTIQGIVSELAQRAKIARILVTAQTMRHTFALKFLESNPGQLVELASLLGQESLRTTAAYLGLSRDESLECGDPSGERSTLSEDPDPGGSEVQLDPVRTPVA